MWLRYTRASPGMATSSEDWFIAVNRKRTQEKKSQEDFLSPLALLK
jgi:hypothetical protein